MIERLLYNGTLIWDQSVQPVDAAVFLVTHIRKHHLLTETKAVLCPGKKYGQAPLYSRLLEAITCCTNKQRQEMGMLCRASGNAM